MDPVLLPELIDHYLLRCRIEGKSPQTIRSYRETLERFARILREQGAPSAAAELTAGHIYAYLDRFTTLSLDTRHRYFREVRCFFNWLVEAGYLEHNPFRGLRNVRLPRKIIRPFTPADVTALLSACDHGTPAGLRDRAMVLLLLDTGIRCSELVSLQAADLDLEGRRLRVLHGKGQKQRVVSFATRCDHAMRDYLVARGSAPGPLFLALTGHRLLSSAALQPNGLKQMLRRLGRGAGVSKVHAHRFRHTFATWAIEHNARELDVQYLLGHASPDMVRRYSSSYGSEQAARRHAGFSPGDQMAG